MRCREHEIPLAQHSEDICSEADVSAAAGRHEHGETLAVCGVEVEVLDAVVPDERESLVVQDAAGGVEDVVPDAGGD